MHLEKKLNKRKRLNEEISLLDEHHSSMKSDEQAIRNKYQEKKKKSKGKADEIDRHVCLCDDRIYDILFIFI